MTDKPATTPSKDDAAKPLAKSKDVHEKKTTDDTPAKKKSATKNRGGLAQYLSKLALLSTLIVAGGLYYVWQNQTTQVHNFHTQISQLDQRASQNEKNLAEMTAMIRQRINEAEQQQKQLNEAVAEMLRTSRHLRQDWLLAEAEYLVNLAGQRLVLSRDINTSIAALHAADERLLEAGDPALIPVRKAIAEDITDLKAVNQPDITGISLKLSTLVGEVDKLRLSTPAPDPEQYEQSEMSSRNIDSWQELPGAIWKDIKGLVTIRDHQGPIKPLLSPEQHFFLTQNLKLQLEQARLALLSSEVPVYKERLDTVKTWVETWFDREDYNTQQVLSELESIRAINIQPQIPVLKRSYLAIKNYQKQQSIPSNKQPVVPSRPETSTPPASETPATPEEKPESNSEPAVEPAPATLPSPSSKQVPL